MDVNQELKFFGKFQKRKLVEGGGEGGSMVGSGLGGQDGCERRIEVFVKIKKKKFFFGGGGGGSGGSGWGVRVDVNRIEVFVKIKKKKIFFFGGGGGRGERSGGGVGGRGRVGGVRVDVNEELKFL